MGWPGGTSSRRACVCCRTNSPTAQAAWEGSKCWRTLTLAYKPPASQKLSWAFSEARNTWKHFNHLPHVSTRQKKSSGFINSAFAKSLRNENRTLNLVLTKREYPKPPFPAFLLNTYLWPQPDLGHLSSTQQQTHTDLVFSPFVFASLSACYKHGPVFHGKRCHYIHWCCNILQGLKIKLVFRIAFHIHKQMLLLSPCSPLFCAYVCTCIFSWVNSIVYPITYTCTCACAHTHTYIFFKRNYLEKFQLKVLLNK